MMQRCSELGNNPEAWQELFRFGKNKLKVKKGPNGHYLERECKDELQKSLPAKSFDSLMSMVATWMARLDEKDKQVLLQRDTKQKKRKKVETEQPAEQLPSEDDDNKEMMSVVDLCSDGEEKESVGDDDDDSFDSETVLSQSSVIIIDDDLGEVNLKDFADHVEGKLDKETLKQRSHKQQSTKQSSILKFLSPEMPDALRRSLKTYEKKRKPSALVNEEAISEDKILNGDTKILRELNREHGQKSRKSDCLVSADLSETPEANKVETHNGFHSLNNRDNTLVASGNPQQNVQIVTEPSAYYNLLAKTSEESEYSELESKSKPDPEYCVDAKENEPKKGLNVEQRERETTKEGASPEDAMIPQRQDNYVPQIRIRTDLGAGQMDVIRVRTDLLHEQPPHEALIPSENQGISEETLVLQREAEKRRLSEAQNSPYPPKRPALESYNTQYVKLGPVPVVAPSYQPSVSTASVSSSGYPSSSGVGPASSALSYKGNPALSTSSYQGNPPSSTLSYQGNPASSTSSYQGNPALSTSSYQGNPTSISPSYQGNSTSSTTSYQGNPAPAANPAPAPPVVTVKYKLIAPRPSAAVTTTTTSSSYQPSLPATSSHQHTPMNPASVSSYGYASNSQMCPVTSTSSHRVVNPTNHAPITHINPKNPAAVAPSNHSQLVPGNIASRHSPVIPMITNYPPSYPYQPPIPAPAAPVATSMYQPGASMAAAAPPLPPSSYPQVPPSNYPQVSTSSYPPVASGPVTAMAAMSAALPVPPAISSSRPNPPMLDPRTDLANIMGMLSQVELLAIRQENQEAFHLVNQLRNSLQRGANFAYHR